MLDKVRPESCRALKCCLPDKSEASTPRHQQTKKEETPLEVSPRRASESTTRLKNLTRIAMKEPGLGDSPAHSVSRFQIPCASLNRLVEYPPGPFRCRAWMPLCGRGNDCMQSPMLGLSSTSQNLRTIPWATFPPRDTSHGTPGL